MFGLDTALGSGSKKPFNASVAEALYHRDLVYSMAIHNVNILTLTAEKSRAFARLLLCVSRPAA
jgi:hypothetical protein